MFIGHFTERPYQDPKSGYFGATGLPIKDLTLSNEIYDPEVGADLYNRYLDEKIYADEAGFDGLMLNEHHSTPSAWAAPPTSRPLSSPALPRTPRSSSSATSFPSGTTPSGWSNS